MSIILPAYVTTYATHTPYVTVNEFMATPTGIDMMNLVPAGGTLTNQQTLANLLVRASSWADSLCNQKLAPTLDTRAGRFQVRNGVVHIPLPFTPVVMVSAISLGWSPSTISLLPDSSVTDVWVDERNILMVPLPTLPTGAADRYFYGFRDIFAEVQYVNGWANATLTAAATAGSTSVTISSGLGVVAGQQLAMYSQTQGETVTVAASYTPTVVAGPVTVPLAAATLNAYAIGDTFTAMPQEIKQAVISLVGVLVKTRATDSMVMPGMGSNVSQVDKSEPGMDTDFDTAMDLLQPYRRAA